jgi:hypothetical protein
MQITRIKLRQQKKTLKAGIEPKNDDVTTESVTIFKEH